MSEGKCTELSKNEIVYLTCVLSNRITKVDLNRVRGLKDLAIIGKNCTNLSKVILNASIIGKHNLSLISLSHFCNDPHPDDSVEAEFFEILPEICLFPKVEIMKRLPKITEIKINELSMPKFEYIYTDLEDQIERGKFEFPDQFNKIEIENFIQERKGKEITFKSKEVIIHRNNFFQEIDLIDQVDSLVISEKQLLKKNTSFLFQIFNSSRFQKLSRIEFPENISLYRYIDLFNEYELNIKHLSFDAIDDAEDDFDSEDLESCEIDDLEQFKVKSISDNKDRNSNPVMSRKDEIEKILSFKMFKHVTSLKMGWCNIAGNIIEMINNYLPKLKALDLYYTRGLTTEFYSILSKKTEYLSHLEILKVNYDEGELYDYMGDSKELTSSVQNLMKVRPHLYLDVAFDNKLNFIGNDRDNKL